MRTYKVELKLVLAEDAPHPSKWVADAMDDYIKFNKGEDITDIKVERIDNESDYKVVDK